MSTAPAAAGVTAAPAPPPPPPTAAASSSPSLVAGVPADLGQPVHVTAKKQLQRQVNAIVGWNELDRAPLNVGAALQRSNEPQLLEHSYFVCERSVGIRYLALLVNGRCYLISPSYDMREVVLFSPVRPDRLQPGVDRSSAVPHQWTLLDGLLVRDKDGPKSVLTLLLYDILALNGSPVMTSKLQDRLKLIQNDVIAPRKTVAPPKGQPADHFQLVLQAMYPVSRVSHVIRTIIPRVSQTRQNAGLVFTPVLLPYTPGYSKGLFHWSPASQLIADFQLGVEWRGRPPRPGFKLLIHDKRTQVFHDWITFTPGAPDRNRVACFLSHILTHLSPYASRGVRAVPAGQEGVLAHRRVCVRPRVAHVRAVARQEQLGHREPGVQHDRARPGMAQRCVCAVSFAGAVVSEG